MGFGIPKFSVLIAGVALTTSFFPKTLFTKKGTPPDGPYVVATLGGDSYSPIRHELYVVGHKLFSDVESGSKFEDFEFYIDGYKLTGEAELKFDKSAKQECLYLNTNSNKKGCGTRSESGSSSHSTDQVAGKLKDLIFKANGDKGDYFPEDNGGSSDLKINYNKIDNSGCTSSNNFSGCSNSHTFGELKRGSI